MITAQGLQIKRLAQIVAELEESFRNAFGENIDLVANAPLGQIIGIISEREALLWELVQDLYNSQYPNTSSGRNLDNSVSLTGTRRKPATFSSVQGIARGADGTLIPAGTIIAVQGNPDARFVTQSDATISVADGDTFKSLPIDLVAESTGPFETAIGTLNDIVTPVGGLESFTNEAIGDVGSNAENDADLKIRRLQELNLAGVATVEAIKSRLSARENVEAVEVFVNKNSITINGRPPHSVEVLVKGDNDDDLAVAIFNLVGGGITYVGNVVKNIIDSQGHNQEIKFSRPVDVPIFVEFTVSTNSLYPVDGDDLIKAATVEFGRRQNIGQGIVLFGSNAISCAIETIPGITGVTIRIGRAADALMAQNLNIEPGELASIAQGNVTIVKN